MFTLRSMIQRLQQLEAEQGDMPVLCTSRHGGDAVDPVEDVQVLDGTKAEDPDYSLPEKSPRRLFLYIGSGV